MPWPSACVSLFSVNRTFYVQCGIGFVCPHCDITNSGRMVEIEGPRPPKFESNMKGFLVRQPNGQIAFGSLINLAFFSREYNPMLRVQQSPRSVLRRSL